MTLAQPAYARVISVVGSWRSKFSTAFAPCLKVKAEGYAWLNAAAIEVNQVWNYANATSYKAAQPFAKPKWLTAFDLDKLTAGASKCFDRIGSETIQRVNAEFATRRKQFNRARLKWRASRGSRRSLGWIPFKEAQLKRKGKSLRHIAKRLCSPLPKGDTDIYRRDDYGGDHD
jgi:hypothetical protein